MTRVPSVQRLLELLSYDPATGVLTWRVRRGGSAAAGSAARSLRSGEAHEVEKWRKLLAERGAQKEEIEALKLDLRGYMTLCNEQTVEIERLRAERDAQNEELRLVKRQLNNPWAAIPTAEQIEEIKRLADECMKEARWVGVVAQTHGGESDLHRANWKASDARLALHAALDALRGSQRGQAASSAVTSAARSS